MFSAPWSEVFLEASPELLRFYDDCFRADVIEIPLRAGGGMRVKIVDAWSWGLPIVSTSIGAEGLEYRDLENLLLADTAEAFAQSLVRLLTDPELAARLSTAGRRTVEEYYDWRKTYIAWDEIYRAVSNPQYTGARTRHTGV